MSRSSTIAVVFASVLSAACSSGVAPAGQAGAQDGPPTALLDTTWRLHEIQSMDDAQGITRPAPDRVYTMRLSPEGQAQFQLDCNRGTGAYTHQAQGPGGGAITFGNLGMTRMMCPPGSLDTRLARDMGFVRSYTIRGETLTMSLMADGGLYVWKPAQGAQPGR